MKKISLNLTYQTLPMHDVHSTWSSLPKTTISTTIDIDAASMEIAKACKNLAKSIFLVIPNVSVVRIAVDGSDQGHYFMRETFAKR